MSVYYNEFDPKAAAWLRELIAQGHLPQGDVDERSIEDVVPSDLAGYRSCHFFAGIGGWAYALRLAGWPDDQPVWTGSCPCQPFSAAGQGAGFADERHLWPAWAHLIAQCRPATIFGEQVASKAADPWIDLVCNDLEGMGYAFGCVPFPAAGVGAPHIRDRNYWVGDASGTGLEGFRRLVEINGACGRKGEKRHSSEAGTHGGMADSERSGIRACGSGCIDSAPESVQGIDGERERIRADIGPSDDAMGAGPSPLHGFWRDADWLLCRDGKWRPVEPGTFPLAHGLPARVVRLRGYGNAIVPQQAAAFVQAAVT